MKRIFASLCIVLGFISACNLYAEEQLIWKIGMPVCLTGDCAADGDGAVRGAQLAADELNSQGGVLGHKVVLVSEDTAEATSGARAVTSFRKLRLDPEIQYFIGPSWTPGGLSLAPLAAKQRDLLITTPSLGVSDFHEAGDNIFNVRGVDESGSRSLANYAWRRGWKSVVVLSSQQPWEQAQGQFFADEFRKLGGKVLAIFEPLPDASSVKTESLKAIKLKPDAVFLSAVVQQALYAKDLRSLGYTGPKFAAYVDDVRIHAAEGALDGTITADLLNPKEEFMNHYKSHYKVESMSLAASTAYDIVKLYAQAIREAKSFRVSHVRPKLQAIHHEGVTGSIQFDAQGMAKRTPFLKQLSGIRFNSIEEKG